MNLHLLPDYLPPNAVRASLAAGLAPLAVLLAFTLLVAQWIEPPLAFTVFALATFWVIHEMNAFQRSVDRYNRGYVERHLAWRSDDALRAMVISEGVRPATRDFVEGFLRADRRVLRDGQVTRLPG